MIVMAASTGKVAPIVLICIVAAGLIVLRLRINNRLREKRVREREDRENTP